MRPKVFIPVLLIGTLALAAIFLFNSRKPSVVEPVRQVAPPVAEEVKVDVVEPKASPVAIPPVTPVVPQVAPTNEVPVVKNEPPVEDPAVIKSQIDRLEDLQSNDDEASFKAILSELTNSSPDVRHAAIEAAIQFGDKSAAPILRDLASRTVDAEEKKELLDAAEFLSLPTLTEAKAAKRSGQSTDTPQQ